MHKLSLVAAILLLAIAPTVSSARADDPAPSEIRVFKTVGEANVSAHIFRPANPRTPRPAVLLFHGGGWVAGDATWVYTAAKMFQGEGLVAISIDYRLSHGARRPTDALADACDAFAWVRANAAGLGVDPKRVAAYGVSAGGQLAAAAGTGACANGDRGPDLMMLWSPALDVAEDGFFRRLMKGADPAPYSPLERVRERRPPPTAIVQGDKDTLTPLAAARGFCAAARKARQVCELNIYPGVGHLLTRNLADQEDNYDPDPVARADGQARLKTFLRARGYTRR